MIHKTKYTLPVLLNILELYPNAGAYFFRYVPTASDCQLGRPNTLLKPPPLKMTISHACSGDGGRGEVIFVLGLT